MIFNKLVEWAWGISAFIGAFGSFGGFLFLVLASIWAFGGFRKQSDQHSCSDCKSYEICNHMWAGKMPENGCAYRKKK